nr:MAG TPA: hypothetical protein [Caudoviricetes sp.]DAZ18210.1 MAG TPA: hypothetical protein [Caudoviricetes sp.]
MFLLIGERKLRRNWKSLRNKAFYFAPKLL